MGPAALDDYKAVRLLDQELEHRREQAHLAGAPPFVGIRDLLRVQGGGEPGALFGIVAQPVEQLGEAPFAGVDAAAPVDGVQVAGVRGGHLPVLSLSVLLTLVLAAGMLASLAATAAALGSSVLDGLRSE